MRFGYFSGYVMEVFSNLPDVLECMTVSSDTRAKVTRRNPVTYKSKRKIVLNMKRSLDGDQRSVSANSSPGDIVLIKPSKSKVQV